MTGRKRGTLDLKEQTGQGWGSLGGSVWLRFGEETVEANLLERQTCWKGKLKEIMEICECQATGLLFSFVENWALQKFLSRRVTQWRHSKNRSDFGIEWDGMSVEKKRRHQMKKRSSPVNLSVFLDCRPWGQDPYLGQNKCVASRATWLGLKSWLGHLLSEWP